MRASRVAIATAVHQARNTARFIADDLKGAADLLPCAAIMQTLALREVGGFAASDFDHVVLHSNLTPAQLALMAAYNITLRRGNIPSDAVYDSEFEAANMLKVDVSGLTEYDRVLFLDLDMLPRQRVLEHLLYEYPEGLVTFAGITSPVSGQLYVVRPNRAVHALMRRLADTHNFSVQRGWAGAGLLTWPDVDSVDTRAQCNATYLQRGAHVKPTKRRRCSLSPFWVERCRRHGMTNWNFMSAASDQGILWYAYNLSGLSAARALPSRARSPDGTMLPLGLNRWVHLQGTCKPWLASRQTLSRSKCLKAGAFFWHGVWDRFNESHELSVKCPTMASAYARFLSFSPREARLPCFWTEQCFQRYKPAWVKD